MSVRTPRYPLSPGVESENVDEATRTVKTPAISKAAASEEWAALAALGIVAGCGGAGDGGRVQSVDVDESGAVPIPIPVAVETSSREPLARPPAAAAAVAADPGCREGSHECRGKNECKGLGGCRIESENACKGQNACKGRGGCKVCD